MSKLYIASTWIDTKVKKPSVWSDNDDKLPMTWAYEEYVVRPRNAKIINGKVNISNDMRANISGTVNINV